MIDKFGRKIDYLRISVTENCNLKCIYCIDENSILNSCNNDILTDDEIVECSVIAKNAGADFVKTSTGFGTAGASVEAVSLMRKTVGDDMGVKASGGIKTASDYLKMVNAGANRIGTSNGITIMEGIGDE